jgi:hypothetical protein
MMSVALVVCQVNTVDWPCWMLSGVADNVAVGAGGGGGGATGWATLPIFLLLQAAKRSTAVNANKRKEELNLRLSMGSSSEKASRFSFELLVRIFCAAAGNERPQDCLSFERDSMVRRREEISSGALR